MKTLTPGMLSVIGAEPRVFDLHLAAVLGMANLYMIRRTIEHNRTELEMHGAISVSDTKTSGTVFFRGEKTSGTVSARGAETSDKGGRPGKAYYLNEGQALVLCALSKTPRAAEIRKLIIDVFMAWRHGKTVPVKSHYRASPESASRRPVGLTVEFHDDGMALVRLCVPQSFALRIATEYEATFYA